MKHLRFQLRNICRLFVSEGVKIAIFNNCFNVSNLTHCHACSFISTDTRNKLHLVILSFSQQSGWVCWNEFPINSWHHVEREEVPLLETMTSSQERKIMHHELLPILLVLLRFHFQSQHFMTQ